MSTSFTGATAGYLAGAQSNDVRIKLAMEATFNVPPAGTYQMTRFTGENFRPQNARQRPSEINGLSESAQAVTTSFSVSGTLSGALSTATYDDLFASVLCGDWSKNIVLNGQTVKTWTVAEYLGGEWLVRSGGMITRAQITFSQNAFAQVAFDFIFADETDSDTDLAGTTLAAPTGTVYDTVSGFGGVTIDSNAVTGAVNAAQITLTRTDAAADNAMGTTRAVGMRPGSLTATGSLTVYFKDYSLYERFKSGAGGPIQITATDGSGKGYNFIFSNATLQNPQINAGGPNQSVMATFDIEGNPAAGGGTFQITRVGAAA